jgi:RND family efflux transporter MFP subunit
MSARGLRTGSRSPRSALLLAALIPLAATCKKDEPEEEKAPPVEVRCVPASRVALDESVTLRGRTAPPPGGDLAVASQVAGRIVEVRAREGEAIRKGAVIAVVDDLAPRAAASQAAAGVARATAENSSAQAALARARTLAEKGITSKAELEAATARAAAAEAALAAEKAAAKLATGTLGRVEVRSTFDGVVTKLWRGPGALVDGTAATPILELAASSAVEFVADATERDLAQVKEGQKAEVTIATTGERLAGAVLARSLALDPATGLGLVRVALEGDAARPAAPLGAFGKVTIATAHREGVLVIPVEALRGAVADGAEIAICNGDAAALRKVRPGHRDEARIEIVEGLKEGEKVAVGHVLGLEDGTKIAPTKGDEGAEPKKDEPKKDEPKKDDAR